MALHRRSRGASAGDRHIWHRSCPCGCPGFHDRRPARKSAGSRGRQKRKFSGQRCERDRRLHPRRGLLKRLRCGRGWSETNSRSARWPEKAATIRVSKVEFTAEDIKKGDFPHYMLKEIFEQPNTVRDAMRGRLSVEDCTAKLGGLDMTPAQLRDVGRIVLTGCGTALHAGKVGEYLIERLANIPTEVEFASEFRHRNTPMTPETLVFAISQSGETADTLGALRESRRKGFRTLGICNNVASTIARESDGGVYMHAGPEIGVAASKSFTSQLVILTLIGLPWAECEIFPPLKEGRIIEALRSIARANRSRPETER